MSIRLSRASLLQRLSGIGEGILARKLAHQQLRIDGAQPGERAEALSAGSRLRRAFWQAAGNQLPPAAKQAILAFVLGVLAGAGIMLGVQKSGDADADKMLKGMGCKVTGSSVHAMVLPNGETKAIRTFHCADGQNIVAKFPKDQLGNLLSNQPTQPAPKPRTRPKAPGGPVGSFSI